MLGILVSRMYAVSVLVYTYFFFFLEIVVKIYGENETVQYILVNYSRLDYSLSYIPLIYIT